MHDRRTAVAVPPHSRSRGGFTLVEILIVVVIMGILAAVVIPKFASATDDSRRRSLAEQVRTLRAQILLYRTQHGDTLPNLTVNWDPLTKPAAYGNPPQTLGPYLVTTPDNLINGSKAVVDGDGDLPASAACGFVYDYAGGSGSGKLFATDENGTAIFVPPAN